MNAKHFRQRQEPLSSGLCLSRIWLSRLEFLSPQDTQKIIDHIPESEISPVAAEFAQTMLILNRDRLLGLKKDL